MYALTINVHHQQRTGEAETTLWTDRLPTLFMDPDVQGIVSEDHAKRIMVNSLRRMTESDPTVMEIEVSAVRML